MTSWIQLDDGSLQIHPKGEIDLAVCPELREVVTEAITTHTAATRLVFDLEDVTFMDSSGLNALIFASNRMRERDGEVVITNPAAAVAQLIRIVGLDQRLTLLDGAG